MVNGVKNVLQRRLLGYFNILFCNKQILRRGAQNFLAYFSRR